MRLAVDTNILVRLLTHDDEKQYQKAYKLFQHSHLYIARTVLLETEWVLRYAYKYSATDIIHAFKTLSGLPNVEVENADILANALDWHQSGLDFADALHLAGSQNCDTFYTFDEKFIKKGKNISNCEVKKPGH